MMRNFLQKVVGNDNILIIKLDKGDTNRFFHGQLQVLHNVKDMKVGINRKVKILEVTELVIKIGLRNKKKVKVNDRMDIIKGKGIRVREDKG